MKSIKLYLLSKLGKWIILLLYNTNKWKIEGTRNYKNLIKNNQSVIISIWHGRVLTFVKHLSKKQYYAQTEKKNGYYGIKKKYLETIPLDLNSFKFK